MMILIVTVIAAIVMDYLILNDDNDADSKSDSNDSNDDVNFRRKVVRMVVAIAIIIWILNDNDDNDSDSKSDKSNGNIIIFHFLKINFERIWSGKWRKEF